MKTTAIVTSLAMMLALATATATAAQASTAFTYQGQLKLDGVPLNNTVDITFTLYNASSNGIVIGSPVLLTDVDVANGLFTSQLDFGASAFDGEARWLDIEIRCPTWDGQGSEPPFTPLEPRQPVTATPYAMQTRGIHVDESGLVGIGTTSPTYPLEVSGAIAATSLQLFPAIEDDPLIIAGFSSPANYIDIQSGKDPYGTKKDLRITTGRHPDWNGNQIRLRGDGTTTFEAGNVGIGTASPAFKLDVAGMTRVEGTLAINESDSPELQFHKNGSTKWRVGSPTGSADFMIMEGGVNESRLGISPGGNIKVASDLAVSGKVGVGTNNPQSRLHVCGGSDATTAGGGYAILGDIAGLNMVLDDNEIMSRSNGGSSDLYLNRDGGNVVIGRGSPNYRLHVDGIVNASNFYKNGVPIATGGGGSLWHTSGSDLYYDVGKIGVGTSSPGAELHVDANDNQVLFTQSVATKGAGVSFNTMLGDSNGSLVFQRRTKTGGFEANLVTINLSAGADTRLEVNGTTKTNVIQITGADIAEKFPVTEEVKPGMVVAIDPNNPGWLCLAQGSYNRCVAGVVSGAGDLPAGAILGNLPGHEDAPPIALTGRVWAYCDADANGPIQPGDLMTTSDTPGHAMKVTDHQLADGAALGKAMTKLESGTGLVLVLVALQ